MNNILINSNSILVKGTVHCSDDVTIHDVVPDNTIFDQIINDDINIKGDLIIQGRLHLINNANIFLNISTAKDYNKEDFSFINCKDIYVNTENFRVGTNVIAYSTVDKYYYRKIKLKEIYNKLQTKRLLNDTIKK